MSPDVPIIVLILAIPTYFMCKWTLRKLKIGNDENRKFIAILPTLILSPIVYIGLIAIWIISISYYPNKDFERSKWKLNVEERYEMSSDIIESNILIGKTKEEITELLGPDFYSHGENHISYELGHVPGLFNIDPDYLDIYFENGVVNKVQQHGG
ncbi:MULTISPECIES: hypothetical protein [Flavobacteriaceae]|uniref:hypothetical protein n=1 Tax=Flavobacteriaceae TaxID=49546 RepID=UPI00234BA895|nr:hypothetical protein [Muricauda sp. SP22]MDC6362395.1 hypothetical protein [Muricauda sp. SP22]